MVVFEEKERTDDSPKARDEGLYAFYDRAARRPFAVFRDLVNEWIAKMPKDAAAEIVSRMRKGYDLGFASGLSEIMLHAAMNRRGFRLEPHPEISGTAKQPDFLIRGPDGERVAYLEITTMNPPADKIACERRETPVFETLNAAALPEDMRLSYEVTAFGSASPSANGIRRTVERWASENAEAARAGKEVEKVVAIDDWRFRLSLISGFRSRPGGRQIAFYGRMNGRVVGVPPSTEGLKGALDVKAKRYGELDLPYLIAVFDRTDSLAWFSSHFAGNVAEVLFGSETVDDTVLASGAIQSHERRARDGWFGYPGAPRRRGVSAVLIFPSAEPWHLAEPRGQPLLVRNPWALRPLPEGIARVNEFVIDEREGRIVNGEAMSRLLNLPDPWPPDEA